MSAADNREIELKLGLLEPFDKLNEVLLTIGGISTKRTDDLENIYYDTKDRALYDLKAGLRVRKGRKCHEQTLKVRGSTLGGVHSRNEYNVDLKADQKKPDLKLFPAQAFPEGTDLDALQQGLVEQCHINFRRESYDLEYKGCVFEISVDNGFILAKDLKAPILELEIELKQAADDKVELVSLFDELVRALAKAGVPLTLEPFSKMHRAAMLMGVQDRNTMALPENPAGNIGAYIAVNLKTFETLLGLYLVKLNPVYLGYMAYTLKCLRRAYDFLLDEAARDDNVNDSQSFRELKKEGRKIKRTLKQLGKFLRREQNEVMPLLLTGADPDLSEAAQKLRRRISKLQAYCLPLHLRALLLRLDSVQQVNQKA